jgi:hypothetical protein
MSMELGELIDAANDYADRINRAEAKSEALAYADTRTFLACQAIKNLGPLVTEREVCNLIEAMQCLIAKSGWSHTENAVAADDSLTDAHALLEEEAEKSE